MSELAVRLPPVSPPGSQTPGRLVAVPAAEEDPALALAVAGVAEAEAAVAENRYDDALALLSEQHVAAGHAPVLALRAALAESWAQMMVGNLGDAVAAAERAREIADQPKFGDVDRAEALFRLGCCRLKLSQISVAASLLTVALELCDRSFHGCDRLRAQILEWRSRCWQRQRDWSAASADLDRAMELGEAIGDPRTIANVSFQAAAVAEREGQCLLARFFAEKARRLYADLDDRLMLARITNNLGGIVFLLGSSDEATDYLTEAFELALAADSVPDAAQAISSLAQVHLRGGDAQAAESAARQGIDLLGDREDFLDEIGNVHLVLGRALLEQDRYAEAETALALADRSFERFASVSHRAAAWVAYGDLARRRGDPDGAADHYRRAADALQDFHF